MVQTNSRKNTYVIVLVLLLTVSLASATDLQNIEEITPLTGNDRINITTNLDMQGNNITNTSQVDGIILDETGNGLVITDSKYAIDQNAVDVYELDNGSVDDRYLNRNGDYMTGNLDLNGYNITNFFNSTCSSDELVNQVYENGSYNCVDPSTLSTTEDLAQTLSEGNFGGGTPIYMNQSGIYEIGSSINLTDSGNIEISGTTDGVNLDNPGNGISLSGDQYIIPSNAINNDEIGLDAINKSQIADSTCGTDRVLKYDGSEWVCASTDGLGTDDQSLTGYNNTDGLNDTIQIENGNNITIRDDVVDADADPTNEYQDLSQVLSNGTSAGAYNISVNGNSIENINRLYGDSSGGNFFQDACSVDGQVVEGINSDGTYSCVDPSEDLGVENLSETLTAGNVANQSIDFDGNNLILNGAYVSGDGDNEGLYVDNSGNVGVGTSSPSQDLDVSNIRLRSSDTGVGITTSTDSVGENILFQNADSGAGSNEGRTQIGLAPSGADTRAFINVYGNSDTSNSGLTRFGGRNNAGIFNVQNSGSPTTERDSMGFEIDPSGGVTGEQFRFATNDYLYGGNSPNVLLDINDPSGDSEQLYVPVASSSSQGLVLEAASSQSADILQIRSNGASSGDLVRIESDGDLVVDQSNLSVSGNSVNDVNTLTGDSGAINVRNNLDLTGQSLLNYFENSCSGGDAATGIYDNGSIQCASGDNFGTDNQELTVFNNTDGVNDTIEIENGNNVTLRDDVADADSDPTNELQNLSEVLVQGNVANQSIDLNGNSLDDVSSVDGGGDSINFDDNLDTSAVNITAGGNVTIGTDLKVWGDIWTRGDVPAENLSETLAAGNSAGNNDIDLNNNNIQNVNQISGNSEAIDVSNDVNISQNNVNDAKAVQFGGGPSGERLVKQGGDLCLGDEC